MSFLYPIFIYLMLPVTLLLFYFILTGAKESFEMFDKGVLEKLRLENRSLSRNARNALFLFSFIFMIFALAQPVIKEGEITVEAKSADILIGIDISDSMKAEDRYPNRLEFAKSKAIELIKQAPHNRIGVLAFAQHGYIVSPLSFDHNSVAFLLSKVKTENITEKGTHLDSMLNSAASMLSHAKRKNLLLFTDGGDSSDFSKEISLAKEKGLRLFIIGVGTEQGSPVKSSDGSFIKHKGNILISKINPEMKSLATQTGGVYIESVLGDGDIKAMLQEIESVTEKSTMKEEKIPQYIQLFYYPLALALFFLLLAFSSLPKARTLLLLGLLFVSLEDAKAGLLDFQKLEDAKEAYNQADYNKSSSIYESYAKSSPEAAYNYANSLYKAKKYDKALEAYGKIKTDIPDLKAKALHNSANALVELRQYQEALKMYEEALKLKDDQETRENYEAVKKFLEEQKKEQKQDNKKEQEQDKESEQNKDSEQEKSKPENEQSKDSSQKSDKKNEASSQKDQEEEQEREKKEESADDSKPGEKSPQSEEKEEQGEASSQKSKEEKVPDEARKEEAEKVPVTMQKMSDLEAKKWQRVIQASQKGHLYRMEDLEHKEDENEKPW